ncbi:GlxA family transcriptional regulator [Actinobacillus vicugnae]|uniref:GlxA family transcriptional regulator n=1 Tax=Actinobacillus vicugnae TaxID=2573093 RepID=UPI0012401340|nr:helix-turn-helix domain-containing protein [Actinobacillus vicugnae]
MPLKIALVLQPNLNLFQFSVPYAIFTTALPSPDLFTLTLVAEEPSVQSHLLSVQAERGLDYLAEADIVMIAGWAALNEPPSEALRTALISAYQRGAYLVGLCYGTYALAYTGLLDGRRATTHWHGEADFRVRFPQIQLDANALYVESDRLLTSAGTSAGLDCCLYLIRKFYGVKIANQVARIMVAPPHREGGQAQFIEPLKLETSQNDKLSEVLQYVRENLQKSHNIDELAEMAHMSRRTFTRHFQKMTGTSFTQWLIIERLQKSLELLESSELSIERISEQIGFQSAVSFRQHFKQRFQVSPNEWRRTFGGNS